MKKDDSSLTASSIMNTRPTVLRETDLISRAASYIMERRFRSLPVVDQQGVYLGVFGVNCLLRLVLPRAVIIENGLTSIPFVRETLGDLQRRMHEVQHKPIVECISTEAAAVHPDTPLLEVLVTLYRTRTSIPVLEPETRKLIGMISYWEVGHAIMQDHSE